VAVLLDTGVVYAYYDRSDRWHSAAASLLTHEAGGLLLPDVVVPEIDHLLGARLGREARRFFYLGLVDASFLLIDLPQDRIARVAEIDRRFENLDLGFVDAAIVALAESLDVRRIATVDRRHFDPLARAFELELLPASEQPQQPPARPTRRRRKMSR
jgi:predicted nucleic acid-binding protein